MSDLNTFGKIPKDLRTIEEMIHKQSKIPGGIVGKSCNVHAVNQWVETRTDCAKITQNMWIIASLEKEATGLKTWVKKD